MSKLRYVDSSTGPALRDEKDRTVARLTWGHGRKREDAEALGPLLAAGPEAVEALKIIEGDVQWQDESPTLRMIRKIIAKAEGRS